MRSRPVGKPSKALASVVTDDELNAAYITPGVFNADLHTAVATAVGVPEAPETAEAPFLKSMDEFDADL